MADINVQRRGASFWPWLLGLIVLALLIWGIMELFDRDDDEVAQAAPAPAVVDPIPPASSTSPVAAAPTLTLIPVAAIVAAPSNYGVPLDGTARVTSVVSDRGFWIEEGGQRMFVVIDEPKPEVKDIDAGDVVMIKQGRVYPSSNVNSIPGALDAETRRIIASVPTVLYVKAQNIEIQKKPAS